MVNHVQDMMDWTDLTTPNDCGSNPVLSGSEEDKVNSGVDISYYKPDDCSSGKDKYLAIYWFPNVDFCLICKSILLLSEDIESQRNAETNAALRQGLKRKQALTKDTCYNDQYGTMKFFNDLALSKIQECQSKIVPLDLVRDNRHWIEWNENKENCAKSTIGCRICREAREFQTYSEKESSQLAKLGGVLRPTLSENYQLIYHHEQTSGHQRNVENLKRLDVDSLAEKLATLKKGTSLVDELYKVCFLLYSIIHICHMLTKTFEFQSTKNGFETVLYGVKVHNSLNNYPMTVRHLQKFGIDMGESHCHGLVS